MSSSFASHQPAGFQNRIETVAIIGIGGRSAIHMARQLVQGKRHRVTGIVRENSTSEIPPEVHEVRRVDYTDPIALAAALRGQDVVVITLNNTAPLETSRHIVDAAVKAGVRWILPNEWGIDCENEAACQDLLMLDRYLPVRQYVAEVGKDQLHWVAVCCGLWYEFSLGGSEDRFGFDFKTKTVTFVDDGNAKQNTSTWAQVGRAVTALLSLKILPEDQSDHSTCLSQFANKQVQVSSFHLSQREMFDSVLRVTGDSEAKWTVLHEDSVERFERGSKMMKEGNIAGRVMMLYTRMMYRDGAGEFNDRLDNKALALPVEDLDEATKVAIDRGLAGEP